MSVALVTVIPSGMVASLPRAGNPLLQFPASAHSLLIAPVKVVWQKVAVAKKQNTARDRNETKFFMALVKVLLQIYVDSLN